MSTKRMIPFRRRLFTVMLLSSVVPLLLLSWLMVHIMQMQLAGATRDDAQAQTQSLLASLDSISAGLQDASLALRGNTTVRRALTTAGEERLLVNELLYTATESARSFARFDLYDSSGICRYSTQGASLPRDLPTDWGLLRSAAQAGGEPVWMAAEDEGGASQLLLLGAVQLESYGGRESGYLVMRMERSGLRALTDGKYPQSDLLILSRFFRPIYSSDSYLNTTLAPQLREQLLSGQMPRDDGFFYSIVRHPGTGLYLVLRQPLLLTGRTLRLLYTAAALGIALCVLVSVGMGIPLSRQISRPVSQLREGFGQVQQDDLETRVQVQRNDEFGELADRFNGMVSALKENRQELLHNQQELNEAQIRMLQAQLNPHFLCNTLDTMKWISKINKVPQVALMSTNLADILRFCISAEEFVPLYREIEILERYIEIQKIRLSDDFSFRIRVEEELYDCLVPKMILQPIVENAILHGLNGMEGSAITVCAEFDGADFFRIRVTDNGSGFPPEMVGRPYRREKRSGHLGLYNVDTILRRHYGEDCGLFLDRGDDGTGASVSARLPIQYEEETEC